MKGAESPVEKMFNLEAENEKLRELLQARTREWLEANMRIEGLEKLVETLEDVIRRAVRAEGEA